MKVFKVDDYDFVAANTPEEAIAWYIGETGADPEDYNMDTTQEVDLDAETVIVEDYVDSNGNSGDASMTFRKLLEQEAHAHQDGKPYLFVSADY